MGALWKSPGSRQHPGKHTALEACMRQSKGSGKGGWKHCHGCPYIATCRKRDVQAGGDLAASTPIHLRCCQQLQDSRYWMLGQNLCQAKTLCTPHRPGCLTSVQKQLPQPGGLTAFSHLPDADSHLSAFCVNLQKDSDRA